jgi:iron(III) transport system ATP-binding protein
MNNEYLKITKLNYEIDKKTIINDLNLAVKEGEFISIMGPSGSGKTSLLRLISGLAKQSKGTIKVNHKVIADDDTFIEPENRNLGLVVQEKVLFPHLNVINNIKFGLSHSSINDDLSSIVEQFKITHLLNNYPHQLSGGEAQRVALARTLVTKPKILLLDEPFNGLDEALKKEIYPDIQAFLKEHKITTIMVSHNIQEVEELSDRSFKLNNFALKAI